MKNIRRCLILGLSLLALFAILELTGVYSDRGGHPSTGLVACLGSIIVGFAVACGGFILLIIGIYQLHKQPARKPFELFWVVASLLPYFMGAYFLVYIWTR